MMMIIIIFRRPKSWIWVQRTHIFGQGPKCNNTFVVSVLSYIWQLEDPTDELLKVEQEVLFKFTSGPVHWRTTADLVRLRLHFGLPTASKSVKLSAIAAKLRFF